jgi:Zinc carboxypeptidase
MRPRPLALLLALAALGAAPQAASAALLDTTISSATAQARTCTARPATGDGVVQRSVTATANGLVRGSLSGTGSGDWDVAIFDRLTGRLVAGSASFGLRELAEGVATKGQLLTVQACRRSGSASSVRLAVSSLPLAAPSGETISLVRVALPTEASREALDATGVDQTEHARPGEQDVLAFGAGDLLALTRAGLSYTVVTADVAKADRLALNAATPGDVQEMPSGRTGYRRLPDFQTDMKALAEEHPDLVKPVTLNHPSLEGRAVEGIEITENAGAADGKPVFLQMGVHHAREWPSAEMPMEWATELVDKHAAGDQRTIDLLGRARVIVVPIINPDGYNLSRESLVEAGQPVVDPGFAYKRRNCRIQDLATPAAGECGLSENRDKGVDPNRNYGGFWGGGGASLEPTNDTYRGPAPFSEPETQNVRELVSERQVTTLITNHTYSDLVLRPPGLKSQGEPPDEPIYKDLGDTMAAENGYASQKSWELYDTSGTTEDWSYYATGGLGFTFEIGKASDADPTGLAGVGFHPPYPVGVVAEYYGKYPTGGGNREAYYKALESTVNADRHAILEGAAPAGYRIRATKAFKTETSPVIQPDGTTADPILLDDRLDTSTVVGPSGTFEWHVNPSTRPIVRKESRTSEIQPEPAQTIDISSAEPVLPPTAGGSADVGTKDFTFEVTSDADRQIAAQIDGADGDDYDLYLYKGSKTPENVVASSTSSGAEEALAYDYPEPGTYVLSVQNWAATQGWTGTLKVFGDVPGSEVIVPAGVEAWTVTCERPDGTVAGTEQIVVDRGERKTVTACSQATTTTRGKGKGKGPRR